MNQHLKTIQDLLQQNKKLSDADKDALIKAIADADKQWSITDFKLDRTEKVKKTTAILLEETIEELEQKRKSVESQNRELEIESSLEKVRTVAMGMRKRDDMLDICQVISKQLESLGIKEIRNVQTAIFYQDKGTYVNYEYYRLHDKALVTDVDYTKDQLSSVFATNMMKGPDEFFTRNLSGKEVKEWYNFQKTTNVFIDTYLETATSLTYYWFSLTGVAIGISSYVPLSEDDLNLFKRFRNVFGLAYRRYIDIEKAEAQAREAQIEAALERVRSRTMGMQKSNELGEVAVLLYRQFLSLEVISVLNCGYVEVDEINNIQFGWMTKTDGSPSESFKLPLTGDLVLQSRYNSWKRKDPVFHQIVAGDQLKKHIEFTSSTLGSKEVEELVVTKFPDPTIFYCGNFSNGYLHVITGTLLSKEEENLLERFTRVFDQTYTRFLDLQKAEAQVREAKIEAALERVRSRAMAMQTSEELNALIGTVFTELTKLDLVLTRCVIWIFDTATDGTKWWMANSEEPSNPMNFYLPYHEHKPYIEFLNKWKEKSLKWVYDLKGQTKIDWDKFLFNETELVNLPEVVKKGMAAPGRILLSASFNNFGGLNVASLEPLSEEHFDILLRFAKVFDLTYTRFNDLKQAEAQAREATIEAALERVRGKAMAMHNSSDLSSTASIIFTELRKLGINPIRCGVGLLNKESLKAQLYSATSSPAGDSLSLIGWVQLSGHPVLEKIYDTWLKNEEYFPELGGQELKSYYELLLAGLSVSAPDWQNGQKQYGHFLPFSVGCLYAWSETPYNDAAIKILNRFATIIDLTFRRYIELQKSEANAREAVKQAALDRVRADIASMRTVADLDKITPLIWNELTILGIPFIRCGVFIMDDSQKLIHTFLSTPDGKAIAAFHLPYNTPGNIAQVLDHWHDKKNYIDRWDESAFTEFANILVKQGELASAEQYLKTIPQGGFYLHFLPFLQGMLYVGNTTQLGEEEIKLIQSVADAFSTAYARYEDFNKLEAAKQQVEKTLVDLKQAQIQLVQSEKMASLGELTAGIAHEIQNPLNFVNNFSEVSNELLEEMKDELAKGNYKDAIDIANDVRQNLEKINHHGKRADGIVKGMLQHSRTSSGQKELTDINVLADEYLRLCYHGLRAKDKSFNASIKTDFDETIGKINIIPQDIGRVILNLLTNAFYAASLPSPDNIGTGAGGFSDSGKNDNPTVWVNTKKVGDKVLISVRDNGPGIPQKVLDKIFQPFFTTKPTGQGTGLGLSLSYDIIKAHAGEIRVETKESEGTEFIISL